MFKAKDKITLNKQHENFIGYETVWKVINIIGPDNDKHYVVEKISGANIGAVISLSCKYVNKNYVTIT